MAALYTYARRYAYDENMDKNFFVYLFVHQRSKADEFVYKCIRGGFTNAQKFLIVNNDVKSNSDETKSKSKKGKLKDDDYMQFFLTEFDNNGFDISDDDENDDDSNSMNESKPINGNIVTHIIEQPNKSIIGPKRYVNWHFPTYFNGY